MNLSENISGAPVISARPYPIEPGTAVKRGAVVKLVSGRVTPAAAKETAAILGIAAENHPGTPDALNRRADGGEILVHDSPHLIFESPAPSFRAASGTETTIVPQAGETDPAYADGALTGCELELAAKGPDSANTDEIGARIPVLGYTASGTVIAKAAGGVPSPGDVYRVYPVSGAALTAVMSLDDEAGRLVLVKGASALKCLRANYAARAVKLVAARHALLP